MSETATADVDPVTGESAPAETPEEEDEPFDVPTPGGLRALA